MNRINLSADSKKIVITFKFDPNIIAKIRTIDGRFWNATKKQWEVPIENILEVVEILTPLGFYISDELKKEIKKQESFQEQILNIKNNPSLEYSGGLPLHDFQKIGLNFIKQMPHSLLGDVPGLGKTIQMLGACEEDSSVLIFTMNSLKFSMYEEIKKWYPNEKVLVIDGDKQLRSEQWTLYAGPKTKNKFVIANYELLIHDFDLISRHKWQTIVCDEATRISNPETKTSKNLKSLESTKRIALTGTPVSNSPIDIFGIFDFLIPRYLGTFYQFKDKYCICDDRFNNVVGYKNLDELSNKVDRFMLRRKKEEVFKDLPPKIVENIVFSLSETEQIFYKSIKEQIISEIKKLSDLDTKNINITVVKMLRLKQATDHTRLVGGYGQGESSKLQALETILQPIIASGSKVIIFTQFAEMLHILKEKLPSLGAKLFTIYGAVDSIERVIRTKEFNDYDGPAIMCMTEAGAYGLNMKSATYIVHYDSPWSIAKLEQREGRADRSADKRIGGELPVTVYNLIAKNTIDEYILKVLSKKNRVSVDILKDEERLSEGGMSKEDIDEILRL